MSTKSKSQLQQELQELLQQKEALLKSKNAAPTKFTKAQQEQLDSIAEQIIDLEEQIELAVDEPEKPIAAALVKDEYVPAPGTENMVHLSIVRGRRFNEFTGEELSKPYTQTFTYGEYKNFKENASRIGYTIVKELYNPFKEN